MLFYDKQYRKSLKYYSKMHASGDHSVSVVIPLAQSYLEHAQPYKAKEVLKKFIAKNPKNISAKRLLSQIYKDDGNIYPFIELTEKIYQSEGDPKDLKELSVYYDYLHENDKLLKALEELIAINKATVADYLTLAKLYAADGNSHFAITIGQKSIQKFGLENQDIHLIALMVQVLNRSGKSDEAFDLASGFLMKNSEKQYVLDLSYDFLKEGMAAKAYQLLDLVPKKNQSDPDIETLALEILLNEKERDRVYAYLRNKYEEGTLTQKNVATFLDLTLKKEDIPLTKEILSEYSIEYLPVKNIYAVNKILLKLEENQLAEFILKNLSDTYRNEHPVVVYGLEATRDRKYKALPEIDQLTDEQKAILIQLLVLQNREILAKDVLISLSSFKNLDSSTILDLSKYYVKFHLEEIGLKRLEKIIQDEIPPNQLFEAWLVLSIANGNSEEISDWLQTRSALTETNLRDIYYLSLEQSDFSLAFEAAKVLEKRFPNDENHLILVNALIQEDRLNEAVELFDKIERKNTEALDLYVTVLGKIAQNDPSFREEFYQVAGELLKQVDLPKSRRRDIAYGLYDLEFEKDAFTIFNELAKGKGIKDPDMRMALNIIQKEITEDQKKWVIESIKNSEDDEKREWVEYLAFSPLADELIGLVTPDDFQDETIFAIYTEYLVEKKQEELLDGMIAELSSPLQLSQIGKAAYENNLLNVADRAYSKILVEDPSSKPAKRELGIVRYIKGDYCSAFHYLTTVPRDYQTNYYIGEIYRFEKIWHKARRYYWHALEDIAVLKEKDVESGSIFAQIMQRFGFIKNACRIYSELILNHPKNPGVGIEFANFLIDIEKLCYAAEVLIHTELENEEDDLAYCVSCSRLYQELGLIREAMLLNYSLIAHHPKETIVYQNAANLELDQGRWRRSVALLHRAHLIHPENIVVRQEINNILYDHQSNFRYAYEYRKIGDDEVEQFHYINGVYNLRQGTSLYLGYEQDKVYLENFIKASDGVISRFKGTRWRADIGISHDFWWGGAVSCHLLFNPKKVGFYLSGVSTDQKGGWIGLVEYHKPSWDLVQQTIEFGTSDKIHLGRSFRLSPRFNMEWIGGWNRYHLDDVHNAATSYIITGGMQYRLYPYSWIRKHLGQETYFDLHYILDKEKDITIRRLPLAQQDDDPIAFFDSVPVNSREIHSGYLMFSKTLNKRLYLNGFSGISYDRIQNRAGWIYGASATIGKRGNIHSTIDYAHTVSTDGGDQAADSVLVDLKFPF